MKIRKLGVEELPIVAEYGEAFLRENGYANFVTERFLKFWTGLMFRAGAVVLAAFDGEEFVGVISAFQIPNPYTFGLIAQEGFWFVRPEYRHTRIGIKLFLAFEEWGREIGANEVRIGCQLGPHYESLSKFFAARGYTHFESEWKKAV